MVHICTPPQSYKNIWNEFILFRTEKSSNKNVSCMYRSVSYNSNLPGQCTYVPWAWILSWSKECTFIHLVEMSLQEHW